MEEKKDFTIDELIGEDPMPDGGLNTPFLRVMASNIEKACFVTNETCSKKDGPFILKGISYDSDGYYYKLFKDNEIIYENCLNLGIMFK